jgi:hypothetical protein
MLVRLNSTWARAVRESEADSLTKEKLLQPLVDQLYQNVQSKVLRIPIRMKNLPDMLERMAGTEDEDSFREMREVLEPEILQSHDPVLLWSSARFIANVKFGRTPKGF